MKSSYFPFFSLWQRYFLRQTFQTFALFIVCFFALYVLVDLSAHASAYHSHLRFKWGEVALYYSCEFIKRIEVLAPFGMLLATIKTLCSLNVNNELVALLASGFSLKTLLRPFIFMSLALVALLYLNAQYIQPAAFQVIKQIEDKHHSQKIKKKDILSVQHVAMEDHSTLLFQNYDTSRQLFFDAYWIRNKDDIYRIRYLFPYTEYPVGEHVDHFTRNQLGRLIKTESREIQIFPEIKFNSAALIETLTTAKDLSLSELTKRFPENNQPTSEKHAQVMSVFFYKLTLPWLCLLAVIAPAPFCVQYTRNLPIFLIYAFSIFGLVAIYLILDAALILGERQAIPPSPAILTPFLVFFGIFGWKYLKLR